MRGKRGKVAIEHVNKAEESKAEESRKMSREGNLFRNCGPSCSFEHGRAVGRLRCLCALP
jgi:hypothetical protein